MGQGTKACGVMILRMEEVLFITPTATFTKENSTKMKRTVSESTVITKTEASTSASGTMKSTMALAGRSGTMAANTPAFIKIRPKTDMGSIAGPMEIPFLGTGKATRLLGTVFTSGRMADFTSASGLTICSTERARTCMRMAKFMLASLKRTKRREQDRISGRTVGPTRASGNRAGSMAMASTSCPIRSTQAS